MDFYGTKCSIENSTIIIQGAGVLLAIHNKSIVQYFENNDVMVGIFAYDISRNCTIIKEYVHLHVDPGLYLFRGLKKCTSFKTFLKESLYLFSLKIVSIDEHTVYYFH